MISAKMFAAQTSAWKRVTPALEHFTRWVNENAMSVGRPVARAGAKERSALIAETAFAALASGEGPTTSVQAATFDMLAPLPRAPRPPDSLNPIEEIEVFGIMANTLAYMERVPRDEVVFRPKFPGCGTVQTAEGDLLLDQELLEIKAVQRPFRGSDFRQLLTYAALGHASGQRLEVLTLLNPRMGAYFSSQVHPLALDLGSGSWFDLMHELVELMSAPDASA